MKNRIIIYHFLPSLQMGGAVRNVSTVVKNLDKKKFENYILAPMDSKLKNWHNIKYIKTPSPRKILKYFLFILYFLVKILNNKDNIVLSTHGRGCGFLVRAVGIFFKFKIIHTFRGFEKNFGFKKINEINKFKIFILKMIEKNLSKKTINVCVSKSELNEVKTQIGITKNCILIYNPVKKILLNKKKKTIDFLIVGRRSYQKGFDIFLEIMEKNPNLKIVWLGNPEGNQFLNANIKKIKNKILKAKNPKYLMEKTKFLLILSRWEGASTICIEALKSGLPIVCLSCRGVDEFVKYTKCGFVITRKELNKRLIKLSNLNKNKYNLLSKKSKKINKLIDLKKIITKYENLYLKNYDLIK